MKSVVAAVCALAAGMLCSCATDETPQARLPGAVVRASALPPPDSRGLEMYWWGFDDNADAGALARHLRAYVTNSTPLNAETQDAWRLNGLRVVSVPRSYVSALEQALKVNGVQRKVLGEVKTWGTLAAGPSWSGTQRLQMAEGELALEAGRLRLIARAWVTPDMVEGRDGEPGLLRYVTRMELAVQHEERDPRREDLLRDAAAARDIQDAGLVLSRTIAGFDVWPNEAVLIFPEPPESDIISMAQARPEPEMDAAEAGPQVPRTPTAGELLLAGRPLGRGPSRRAVIVLMNVQPQPTQ